MELSEEEISIIETIMLFWTPCSTSHFHHAVDHVDAESIGLSEGWSELGHKRKTLLSKLKRLSIVKDV